MSVQKMTYYKSYVENTLTYWYKGPELLFLFFHILKTCLRDFIMDESYENHAREVKQWKYYYSLTKLLLFVVYDLASVPRKTEGLLNFIFNEVPLHDFPTEITQSFFSFIKSTKGSLFPGIFQKDGGQEFFTSKIGQQYKLLREWWE